MKLVLVEWLDASTYVGSWHSIGEDDGIMPTLTVGLLCGEDEDQLVVGYTRNSVGKYTETIAIPKGCIKRIRKLKVA